MHTDLQQIEHDNDTDKLVPTPVPFSSISKTKHIQAEGVYIKTTLVPKNVKFYTKQTPDSHVAILAYGTILMDDGSTKTQFHAPANYIIPANSRIAFYTVTDCVFYCVHATEETDLEQLDRIY
jgi:hypothetical protein